MRIFFDMDDVLVKSSPLQQKELDRMTIYTDKATQAVDDLMQIAKSFNGDINLDDSDRKTGIIGLDKLIKACRLTYERVKKLVDDAKRNNMPVDSSLIPLAKLGSNDILKSVKDVSKMSEDEKNNLMYEVPLERIRYAWNYIANVEWSRIKIELNKDNWSNYVKKMFNSKTMLDAAKVLSDTFGDFHDHFLETNNKIDPDKNIINYRKIYSKENLIDGALDTLKDCYDSSDFQSVEILSHHNGGYEFKAKEEMISSLLDGRNIKFNGLFFHGGKFHDEHKNDGKRRTRSSKALYILDDHGYTNIRDCVLVDDSTANCDEWARRGGIAILYRPMSEEEQLSKKLRSHCKEDLYYERITSLSKENIQAAIKKALYRRVIDVVKKEQAKINDNNEENSLKTR